MELGKRSHSVYKSRYHIVTAVKYRRVLLNREIEECVREILKGISEGYEIVIDEGDFYGDHIHFFCGFPPRISALRFVRTIKSINARRILDRFPKLKRDEVGGAAFWSHGKYIGTVGEARSEKRIRNYVRNQGETKKERENGMKQLKSFTFS